MRYLKKQFPGVFEMEILEDCDKDIKANYTSCEQT